MTLYLAHYTYACIRLRRIVVTAESGRVNTGGSQMTRAGSVTRWRVWRAIDTCYCEYSCSRYRVTIIFRHSCAVCVHLIHVKRAQRQCRISRAVKFAKRVLEIIPNIFERSPPVRSESTEYTSFFRSIYSDNHRRNAIPLLGRIQIDVTRVLNTREPLTPNISMFIL